MLKYDGGGAFLVGVPARDLSDEEVKRYGGKSYLLRSGLYFEVKQRKVKAENKAVQPESENKEN